MGRLRFEGSLTGGPPAVTDSSFPASSFLVDLGFATGHDKSFDVASGVLTRQLASPSAFVALSGVGASDAVTQASALYFKCNATMQLEVTFHPPTGPDVVSVMPVSGPLVLETPDDFYIVGLRCKGSGPIEYLVAGLV